MNRSRAYANLALLLGAIVISTSSCTKYVPIPRSDWEASASDKAGVWKIKTATMVYSVQRFATTDSTVVLLEATAREIVGGASYPASATSAIQKSELPIVLRVESVESIERGGISKGRTVGAIFGIGAATAAADAQTSGRWR